MCALVGAARHLALRWLLDGSSEPLDTIVENRLALNQAVGRELELQ